MVYIAKRVIGCLAAGVLVSSSAYAGVCDYKPSKLVGKAGAAAVATVGGATAAAGAGLQAAGYYTLVHSTSGLVMMGSTAAGASAAGTTGIIAGSAGTGAYIASILMAPVTVVVGAVTIIGVGTFEGACYFQIDRIEDSAQVREIAESIAANDPAVSIEETDDGPAMVLQHEDEQKSFLISNLYIADGTLMHRDRFLNTNLGPVAYVEPEPAAEQ